MTVLKYIFESETFMDKNNLLHDISETFQKDFLLAYKQLKGRGKNRMLPHMMAFYRRWLYSTMVENTVLTPANLWLAISDTPSTPTLLMDVPTLGFANRTNQVTFERRTYSLSDHLVVADLKLLLDSCVPDFELTEDDTLVPAHQQALLEQMSICDPHYIEYLALLAVKLNLFTKIPSIHSSRAQLTNNVEKLFALPKDEVFDIIVQTTIDTAAQFISEIIPDQTVINNAYLLSLLKSPVPTDDIFKIIYEGIGLNIEKIMDMNDEDMLDDMYSSILSSTFYLGVVMDKYFFSPLGFYLKLINPSYLLLYDMKKEMNFAMEALSETNDLSIALFSPCSHFHLTPLGYAYFQLPATQEPRTLIPPDAPLEELVLLLSNKLPISERLAVLLSDCFLGESPGESCDHVYEIKVKLGSNKNLWKNIELLETASLHALYMEICYEFNFEIQMNYNFFADKDANPFSQYSSPLKKKRTKSAESTTLQELNFLPKHQFLLVLYDTPSPFSTQNPSLPLKTIPFELTVVKIKDRDSNHVYPRISRTGRQLDDFDMDWLF